MDSKSEDGVFKLISDLCSNIAESRSSGPPSRTLISKLRSHSYELILKSSPSTLESNPISDLISFYYITSKQAQNVAEYVNAEKLKKMIEVLRETDFGNSNEIVQKVLKLLTTLSSTEKDYSDENYQKPLTFGILDQLLPKPKQEVFGSVEPYSYYPPHIFNLPFSLHGGQRELQDPPSQCCTLYTVGCFDPRSFLPARMRQNVEEFKTFLSPMSLASLSSSNCEPISNPCLDYKLPASNRNLEIPKLMPDSEKVSLCSKTYEAKDETAVDIWELASQLDKECPDDIWEIVAIMPPANESVTSCGGRVVVSHPTHGLLTEEMLLKHIICLLFGIETTTFYYNKDMNVYKIRDEKTFFKWFPISIRLVRELLLFGTYHKRIYDFAFNPTLEDGSRCKGDLYEAAKMAMREYLVEFRLKLSAQHEISAGPAALPSLMLRLQQLKHEVSTVARLITVNGQEPKPSLPDANQLLAYLFRKASQQTHAGSSAAAFRLIISLCRVYFKFIELFMFAGELDDRHFEFFIKREERSERCRSNRYWNEAFYLSFFAQVPQFLEDLAKRILLCGKTLRLLKICNLNDPLVYLITSDHPKIRVCTSLEQLEEQKAELEVYRTRCRFVGGEPVTFEQILLEKEAERQARVELASARHSETVEKIIAERKRLAQLMIAEKKHSLRVLKAAMREAKAAKEKAKMRTRVFKQLEEKAAAAAEEVDSVLRDTEKTKLMEYYLRLNEHVEKSKMHTEWRFKRLQLDQDRIQLLSTEERNFKREKMELECNWNEVMAMSTRSDIYLDARSTPSEVEDKLVVSCDDINIFGSRGTSEYEMSKNKPTPSFTDAIDTVDGDRKLDQQGNVITTVSVASKTSSSIIGYDLDSKIDNQQYLDTRQQALLNKQTVMAHEFATDMENNIQPIVTVQYVDVENNLEELTANQEARRNKHKVLGDEFNMAAPEIKTIEPRTDAQREALVNKQKVLGAEYHLPCEIVTRREPANIAQEEALKNKKKVLESEFGLATKSCVTDDQSLQAGQGSAKRSNLKLNLNLKPPEFAFAIPPTAKILDSEDVATPCVLNANYPDVPDMLNVETPNQDCTYTNILNFRTPVTETVNNAFDAKRFDYSALVDEESVEILANETLSSDGLGASPIRNLDSPIYKNYEELDGFDPFGLKRIRSFSDVEAKDDESPSGYTHAALIMEEVRKKPSNMFLQRLDEKETCDNVASLAVCLHRSVLQPLTYQLEVVNNSILSYFLVNLDMYGHMSSLKDYFFLLDGDFSRSVCNNLFAKLAVTTNPQELLNFVTLRGILDKALGTLGSQYRYKYSDNLSFAISEAPLSFQQSSPDVLQCLSLAYTVEWPLNIILSKDALIRYSRAFQFLLKMKRISWVLMEDFEYLKRLLNKKREFARQLRRSPQYITLHNYRHIMATLIRALDNYITTSCVLASWREFEDDLKKARTLDDLYECHAVYVKKVLYRCLLNKRSTPVMKLFNDIFTVVLKFSRVLQTGTWRSVQGHFVHDNYEKLAELFHIFWELGRYLRMVITRLLECNYQPQLLSGLLTSINFNNYFVSKNEKQGVPARLKGNP